MDFRTVFSALLVFSSPLWGQTPNLRPGEALAMISQAGEVAAWGDTETVSPMGNLAKILWLRLEADEWEALGLETRCRGELNGVRCTLPKGHGRVDLPKSFKEDCNVAFSIWVNLSLGIWKKDFGDGGARHRLNEIFAPFLGERLPKDPPLPPKFDSEWYADGQLLQASPSQLAHWLARPSQERLLRTCRNYLLGFTNFISGNTEKWWIKVSEAPTLKAQGQDSSQKQFWVLGGNTRTTVILRLPTGGTAKDAQARFRALLNIKK